MEPQDEASLVKIKNVIYMAITFSAMNRGIEGRAKPKIAEKLECSLGLLAGVGSKEDFEKIHSEFCEWFVNNICKSKSKKGLDNKNSQAATYGQAARIFNTAAKVYVYYCHLPGFDSTVRLLPMLHAAVNNKMMENLKKKYPKESIKVGKIEAVSKSEYVDLQELVAKHINDEFKNLILPVHYDDIMWHRLNRSA
jgi:hypothetical protein